MSAIEAETRDPVVERIGAFLGVGTVLIVATVAVGSLLVVATGRTPVAEHGPALDASRIPAQVLALQPDGWLWLGLLLTVALPIARVVLALLGFVRTGEARLAAISLGTLTVLAVSIVIALVTR